MTHILVTGGTGFTGGHLCRRLANDGHQVRALVRDPVKAQDLLEHGVEIAEGDLRDRQAVDRAARGVDLVYHIGALFRSENVSNQDMWDTNVLGTKNLLEAALKARVSRFVHCSTVGVHGDVKMPPATEEAPFSPGDRYQASKLEAEVVVSDYMADGKLPIVVMRPAGIYGPGDVRFLKLFRAVRNRTFVMLGSGLVYYQMIYIDDLVEGILLCGTKPQAVGNAYILAGDEIVTLSQLVELVAETLGAPAPRLRIPFTPVYFAAVLCEVVFKPFGIQPPLFRRRVDFFRKNRAFSAEKAKRDLGFQPTVGLAQGLRRTAEWYERTGKLRAGSMRERAFFR